MMIRVIYEGKFLYMRQTNNAVTLHKFLKHAVVCKKRLEQTRYARTQNIKKLNKKDSMEKKLTPLVTSIWSNGV